MYNLFSILERGRESVFLNCAKYTFTNLKSNKKTNKRMIIKPNIKSLVNANNVRCWMRINMS